LDNQKGWEMFMQHKHTTYRNHGVGLEVFLIEGIDFKFGDTHPFRVVFRDSDADATVVVRFKRTLEEAMEDIEAFLLGDFVCTGEKIS
tara:strand:+ start:1120 stop:1383 length:264 start_codon:yes stop_codon:yes gene_type:complete